METQEEYKEAVPAKEAAAQPAKAKGFFDEVMPEPRPDKEREERMKRVARVNAWGDLMKHLGAFAGGGNAPVEKRRENQGVLRAFAQLDKIRDVYDARKERYNAMKQNNPATAQAETEKKTGTALPK